MGRDIFEEVKRIIKGNRENEEKFDRAVRRLNEMEADIISEFIAKCAEEGIVPTDSEIALYRAGINATLGELPRILTIMLLDEDLDK